MARILIGFVLSFLIGALCRYFDIPAASPAVIPSALIVLAMTLRYSSMGRVVCDREESLRRPGRSTGCNDEKPRLRRQTPMSREILGIHHITAIRRRSATHES